MFKAQGSMLYEYCPTNTSTTYQSSVDRNRCPTAVMLHPTAPNACAPPAPHPPVPPFSAPDGCSQETSQEAIN